MSELLNKRYHYKGFHEFSMECANRHRVGKLPHCTIAVDKASDPRCTVPNCPLLARAITDGQFTKEAMRECYIALEKQLRYTYRISFSENIRLS